MAEVLGAVWLLAVPLESDNAHTFWFDNATEQNKYFKQHLAELPNVIENPIMNCTYLRKENIIRYPANYEHLIGANYVMYLNSTSNKYYYAFITKMEYINEGMTNIYIETDVMQTWLCDKDYHVNYSFVEREHVDDDTIGKHTYPEGLETGDYVINNVVKWEDSLYDFMVCVGTTVDLNNGLSNVGGELYGGLYSGVKYYMVNYRQAGEITKTLAKEGKVDALVAMFACPSNFVDFREVSGGYAEVITSMASKVQPWQNKADDIDGNYVYRTDKIVKPTTFGSYTQIKNNKLFTYPYCYLNMTNGCGGNAIYKYELFKDTTYDEVYDGYPCDFEIHSTICPSLSGFLVPLNYNGSKKNYQERLQMGKYPICAWSSDIFTNWLTQNGVNIATGIISGTAQASLGIASVIAAPATGGASVAMGVGIATSGFAQISSTIGEIYQRELVPPQAEGQLTSADVAYSSQQLTFIGLQMAIKPEMAQIIDDYFTMYGYKVCRVKKPLTKHRARYWFTKTIDVHIDGNIPVEDLEKIKAVYNKGFTYWIDRDNIGDYSISNNIILKEG